MFRTRLLSGILLVLVLIGIILPGGWVTTVAFAVVSMIGVYELYRVFQIQSTALALVGYLATAVLYLQIQCHLLQDGIWVLVDCLILLLAVYVFSYPKFVAHQVLESFFGLCYVALLLSFICQIRQMEQGLFYVWLIFLTAWGCDTLAYCVGKLFGKHKLAPVLSPKKSVEGSVGGVVGAGLLGAIYGYVLYSKFGFAGTSIWYFAIICALGGVVSQVGDLAASAIKRNYDIKDYGTLIPGHGGILDRFDSVIITAPLIYYLILVWFQ